MKKLIVSGAPHIRTGDSVQMIMWTVGLSLLPAAAVAVVVFGLAALKIILVCSGTAVLTEFLIELIFKKKITAGDGSAFVTGILLAFNLPPEVPLFVAVAGSVFAIAIVKMLFGGLGYNFLNPALAARVFILFAWLPEMTAWTAPAAPEWFTGLFGLLPVADTATFATPLGMMKLQGASSTVAYFGGHGPMLRALFAGNVGGSLGEVSGLALLIGGLFLLARKVITIEIPLAFLASLGLFTWVFGGEGFFKGDFLFHLLSGGALLGAFFMATDMVTSPITRPGMLIF